ncbi:hypothetical protein POTOM_054039 [Populus tomentosa]|uniref:J domain-containing protein n=1 Tax=Populus tomentosa TaxID=118781 RepID=A0A8X7XYH2_POPTO|nr:hypothetical protein POTOM_054039 [Populus tomentosa]
MSSMASKIKAYSVPVFLFSLSVFYQLVVLPRSFPASHYDVLGIKRYSSVEEVKEAYDKMNSEAGIPATSDFIKIQYAYELLTNPLWKRDYDIFGIDEQAHIMDKINLQYAGESISGIELPLLEATTFDLGFHTFNEFTSQEFAPMFDSSKPRLVLVYSLGSKRCAQFFSSWIDISIFEVESAPAIVFVKDSGVKPVVVHGMVNNSEFLALVEKNKQQELPQLRSATSMELGCDARGHSRAGNDTISWYCVILAGRLGPELNKMREIMRRIQERLSIDSESSEADEEQPLALTGAFKGKRLTFTWLDGEAQEKYCSYYLHSETSYDTCGPRRDLIDVPKLFIVRYKRNASEDDIKVDTKPKNIFNVFEDEDVDPASQLVARYNGSDEISQIMLWMSEIIRDGDTRNLPFYVSHIIFGLGQRCKAALFVTFTSKRGSPLLNVAVNCISSVIYSGIMRSKTPALVPEDSEPIWSRGAQSIFSKSIGIKQRIYNNISRIYDYLGDPRIGPILLLGALMSFGTIWLIRSQSTHPTQASQLSQSNVKVSDDSKSVCM